MTCGQHPDSLALVEVPSETSSSGTWCGFEVRPGTLADALWEMEGCGGRSTGRPVAPAPGASCGSYTVGKMLPEGGEEVRLPAQTGAGNSTSKGAEAGRCKELSRKAPDSVWLVHGVGVEHRFSDVRASTCLQSPDALPVCSGRLRRAGSLLHPGSAGKPWEALELGEGKAASGPGHSCWDPVLTPWSAQPGLELEAGSGTTAGRLALKEKGKVREKRWREGDRPDGLLFCKTQNRFQHRAF